MTLAWMLVPVVVPVDRAQTAPSSASHVSSPQQVFDDVIVQLAALDPIAALAAVSPTAALAALSPVLQVFNPAINIRAALLAFNPAAAAALAVAGNWPAPPFPLPFPRR